MRVALLIDNLSVGGAQKHVVQLARGLCMQGCSVWVYCLNSQNVHQAYCAELEDVGAELRVLNLGRVLCGWGIVQITIELWLNCVEVAALFLFGSTVVGRLAAALAGNLVVVTCIQARNLDFRFWQFALLSATAGLSTVFTSNSRTAISFACEREGASLKRSVFVPNSVDVVQIASPKSLSRKGAGLPFDESAWLIGSVGRLVWQKGFDILLESLAILLEWVPEARLIIVGDGRERAALLKHASKLGVLQCVYFAGECDATAFLRHFDIYVQPSRFEGTPNALMEAMAAGKPVVATGVDGNGEIIQPGQNGWLVPPDDAAQLACSLALARRDPRLAHRMGDAAHATILERFTFERMILGYVRTFGSAVSANAGASP